MRGATLIIALILVMACLPPSLPAPDPMDVAWKLIEASNSLRMGDRDAALRLLISAYNDLREILRALGYWRGEGGLNLTVKEYEAKAVEPAPSLPMPEGAARAGPWAGTYEVGGVKLSVSSLLSSKALISAYNDTGYLISAKRGDALIALKVRVLSFNASLILALRGSSGRVYYPLTPYTHAAYRLKDLRALYPTLPVIGPLASSLSGAGEGWLVYELPEGEGLAGLLVYRGGG